MRIVITEPESDLIKFVCSQPIGKFRRLDTGDYALGVEDFQIKVFKNNLFVEFHDTKTGKKLAIGATDEKFMKFRAELRQYFDQKEFFESTKILYEFHKKLINKN